MTLLEVRVRYFAHDFWVHPSLLGWSRTFKRNAEDVEVKLPAGPAEFQSREHEQQAGTPVVPSVVEVATYSEPDWDNRTVAVRIFSVTARLDRELPPARPVDPFEGEFGRLAGAFYQEGQELCDGVAQDLLRWLRASTRQPWLGLVADPPQQYGRAGLYYTSTGEGIFGIGPERSQTFRSSRLRLEQEALDLLVDKLAQQAVVPVAQALLADAWHLSSGPEVPDAERAVLLAAIACEVRTQEFLRESVPGDRKALLEVTLRRTSTLSVLLHDVFHAALDVSLKESDPDLFKRIRNLTRQRNSIVHEGHSDPAQPIQGGAALVASDLFTWLEGCLPQSTSAL